MLGFKCICRGDGTANFLLKLRALPSHLHYEFSVIAGTGAQLPCAVFSSDEISGIQPNEYVLTMPLLHARHTSIIIETKTEDGHSVKKRKKAIIWFWVKYLSKANYLFRKKLSEMIRDVNQTIIDDHPVFRLFACSVYFNIEEQIFKFIVKGQIRFPECNRDDDLYLIDDKGNKVVGFDIHISKKGDMNTSGVLRHYVDFSLEIPNDSSAYCLVAKNIPVKSRDGFALLDRREKDRLLGSCESHPYHHAYYDNYVLYRRSQANLLRARKANRDCSAEARAPFFSIIVPVYQTPIAYLNAMIESALDQSFESWELIIVNASPHDIDISHALSRLDDDRIRVITLASNLGISDNTNAGILEAKGKYIGLFDHDDRLDPNCLNEYYRSLKDDPSIDVLYCDEDFINQNGKYTDPHFKSKFNLDLLRSHNYITHFLVVRSTLLKEHLLRSEYDGAQDYDLLLRLSEVTSKFCHVPYVLYHWRMHEGSTALSSNSKSYADDAGRRALQSHAERLGLNANAHLSSAPCHYDLEYQLNLEPSITIVIPNKDSSSMLERCICSILEKTEYSNYEILIVENNSETSSVFALYEKLKKDPRIRVIEWEQEFNYSAINNYAVSLSKGEFIVLLNNDTEVISGSWLRDMCALCKRKDVGAVGARLLYPDDTVQHAGLSFIPSKGPNEYGGPIHIFANLSMHDPGYKRRSVLRQDVIGVTGACLMTPRSLYQKLEGLDQSLRVAFNDVDYCLKVIEAGYLVVYEPRAMLYHYESVSRGSDDAASDNYARFLSEQGILRSKWSKVFLEGDKYHERAFC